MKIPKVIEVLECAKLPKEFSYIINRNMNIIHICYCNDVTNPSIELKKGEFFSIKEHKLSDSYVWVDYGNYAEAFGIFELKCPSIIEKILNKFMEIRDEVTL